MATATKTAPKPAAPALPTFGEQTDLTVFATGGRDKQPPKPEYVEALKTTGPDKALYVPVKTEEERKAAIRELRRAAESLGVTASTRVLPDRIVFRQVKKRTRKTKPAAGTPAASA